jgi:hypothetical protein
VTAKKKGILPPLSPEWILKRCEADEDGHLIWTGCMAGGKDKPVANTGPSCGDVPFIVRRAIWKQMHGGREPRPDRMVRAECGRYGCVSPECLAEASLKFKLLGKKTTILHRANIAKAKREKSKLAGKVEDIRTSELPREQLAQEHGISVAMVGFIQTGKNWRNYSAPEAALL